MYENTKYAILILYRKGYKMNYEKQLKLKKYEKEVYANTESILCNGERTIREIKFPNKVIVKVVALKDNKWKVILYKNRTQEDNPIIRNTLYGNWTLSDLENNIYTLNIK